MNVKKNEIKQSYFKQTFYESNPEAWWACGPATLLFALESMGKKTSPQKVISIIRQRLSKEDLLDSGVQVEDLKRVFNYYDIDTRIINVSTENDLYFELKHSSHYHPIIVMLDMHVICVFKAEERKVYYNEPDEMKLMTSCLNLKDFKRYVFSTRGFAELMILQPN